MRFFASYQLESNLELMKFPLKIPFKIEYKLDTGSDPVLFLSTAFAFSNGINPEGLTNISWNRLV